MPRRLHVRTSLGSGLCKSSQFSDTWGFRQKKEKPRIVFLFKNMHPMQTSCVMCYAHFRFRAFLKSLIKFGVWLSWWSTELVQKIMPYNLHVPTISQLQCVPAFVPWFGMSVWDLRERQMLLITRYLLLVTYLVFSRQLCSLPSNR